MTDKKIYFHAWRGTFGKIVIPILIAAILVAIYFMVLESAWFGVVVLSIVIALLLFGLLYSFLWVPKHIWYSGRGVGDDKRKISFNWEDVYITAKLQEVTSRYHRALYVVFMFSNKFLDETQLESCADEIIAVLVTRRHIQRILPLYEKPIKTIFSPTMLMTNKSLSLIKAHNTDKL